MEDMEVRPEVRGFFLTHYYYVPILLLVGIGIPIAVFIDALKIDMAAAIAAFAIIIIYSVATVFHSRWHCKVTKLTADKEQVVYETGILHHMRKKIPIHMITDTAVDMPLYERMLGVCTLCVSTAGTKGYDVEAQCIPYAQAKEFHTKLYHVINKTKFKPVGEDATQKAEEGTTRVADW